MGRVTTGAGGGAVAPVPPAGLGVGLAVGAVSVFGRCVVLAGGAPDPAGGGAGPVWVSGAGLGTGVGGPPGPLSGALGEAVGGGG